MHSSSRVVSGGAAGNAGITGAGDEEGTDGDDDEDEESVSSLFLGNLPKKVSGKWVHAVFSKFGKVKEVFFPRRYGRFPGFVFVRLMGVRSARDAIVSLNGCWVGGHRVIVHWASRRKQGGKRVSIVKVNARKQEGYSPVSNARFPRGYSRCAAEKLRGCHCVEGSVRVKIAGDRFNNGSVFRDSRKIGAAEFIDEDFLVDKSNADSNGAGKSIAMVSSSKDGGLSRERMSPITAVSRVCKDGGCYCSNGLNPAIVKTNFGTSSRFLHNGNDSGFVVHNSGLGNDFCCDHCWPYVRGSAGYVLGRYSRSCRAQFHDCMHDDFTISYPNSQVMNKGGLTYSSKGTQVDFDETVVLGDSGDMVKILSDVCVKEPVAGCALEPDPQAVAICSRRADVSEIASNVPNSPFIEQYCGDPVLSHAVADNGGVFESGSVGSCYAVGSSSVFALHEVPVDDRGDIVSNSSSGVELFVPRTPVYESTLQVLPEESIAPCSSKPVVDKEFIRNSVRSVRGFLEVCRAAGVIMSDSDQRIITRVAVAKQIHEAEMED